MSTSSINISALDNLIGALVRASTSATSAKNGCSGPMKRVWVDTTCLSKADDVIAFIDNHLPDLRRRLALAQHIEASEPGFQNYVQFNNADLPTGTPEQAAADGKAVAQRIKDGDLDADLLARLEKGQSDPYFAKALAENISPTELAQYVIQQSNKVRSAQGNQNYDPEGAKHTLDDYGRMLRGLGSTLGLATRGNGDMALPADYADRWIKVLTQSTAKDVGAPQDPDHMGVATDASGLGALLGQGQFGSGFTLNLTRAVLAHEKLFEGVRIWQLRAGSDGAVGLDGNPYYDPLTGLMAAVAKDPAAGNELFTHGGTEKIQVDGKEVEVDSLIRYLITQRRWPIDGGQNLSDALMMAMTPREGGPISSAQIQRDAYNVSKAFQKEIEDRSKDHGPLSTFGHFILDVVGLVPVVGEIADGLNAVWYAAEGDVLNASLSAAGAVPFVGWVAIGGKWVKKTLTAADIARLGLKWSDLAKDAPRSLKLLAIGKGVDDTTFVFNSERAVAKAMDTPHPGITYQVAYAGRSTNYTFDAAGNLSVVRGPGAAARTDVPAIPDEALSTLRHIETHNGSLPPGFKGNKPYTNVPGKDGEARFPAYTPGGDKITYTEYDIAAKVKNVDRGGRRILKGTDGSVWYTDDHYKTVVRMR